LGVAPAHATPDQFRALLEKETARWAEIVTTVGVVVP
jgi:tripartite-type tricarboxylate transporter receptor subunit TctC